ncbi:MAG TPA: sensor histidine kinase [Solirubrobacterales bacterium]|nr:sensor histidine kinase [Solirubrobacterales bacterium]
MLTVSECPHSAQVALAAQESERKRVARELHDEVGQGLVAIALMAERAAAEPPGDGGETYAEIARRIHFYLDELRRIAHELRPEMLDDLGLIDALVALAASVGADHGLIVERDLPSELELSGERELVVYRVAQEALSNAGRHAGALRARLAVSERDGVLRLEVDDDGRGFPPGSEPGVGIKGMRERARLAGAALEIGPGPGGRGTRVRLELPLGGSA